MIVKLKIIDEAWAVGKKTRRVKTLLIPLTVGETNKIQQHGPNIIIDEITDGKVTVSFCRDDQTRVKTVTVSRKNSAFWRPRSMDAGHQYTVKLVRFF